MRIIFRYVYEIDMKFDRQLRPATETSWVISYGGKTIPRWRTAAILKIVTLPYLSEKSSDFDEILYPAADFELDERHVIKYEKVAVDSLRVRQNVFVVGNIFAPSNSPRTPTVCIKMFEKIEGVLLGDCASQIEGGGV